ncbi:MAG: YcaO-like family protein [Pseudomonadota bacterium]
MQSLTIATLLDEASCPKIAKTFTKGTHRAAPPEHLIDALRPDFATFGITRVARITGLDRIGIEVFTVARPNSRGLSVTQGKGADRRAAMLSGVMEAIECWHAERPACPLFLRTPLEVVAEYPQTPIHLWDAVQTRSHPILWTMAHDLVAGHAVPVPFDLVHTSFRGGGRPYQSGHVATTNGLASGTNLPEALTHALCEVIERDATVSFGRLDVAAQDARAVDLARLDDPVCLEMVERCAAARIDVTAWETTGDIAVPSFVACLHDQADRAMPPGFGAGCHLDRHVALSRAIAEAAQARLTRIAGARDDLAEKYYHASERIRAERLVKRTNRAGASHPAIAPDLASDCLAEDLRRALACLSAAGHAHAFALSLASDPRFSVVRVIVPGLAGLEHDT